jgi:hypothetical protein
MMMVSRSHMAMDSSTVLVGDWILGLHSKVFLLQWMKMKIFYHIYENMMFQGPSSRRRRVQVIICNHS